MLPTLLLAAAIAVPQEATPSVPLVAFTIDPAVEQWSEVRALAADVDHGDEDDPLAPAVERARELAACFSSPRFLELVDAHVVAAEDGATFVDRISEGLPLPPRALAAGRSADDVAAAAGALAGALEECSGAFVRERWPERRDALAAARASMLDVLDAATQDAIAGDVEAALELARPAEPVEVFLVTRMPDPGGVTLRTGRSAAACVVRAADRETSSLAEVVVHETLHALVTRQRVPSGLFDAVATRLRLAGVGDGRWRAAAVHTLYFVAAGDLVRAHVDPEHVDYGEREGVYERSNGLAAAARAPWRRYRSAEVDAAEFARSVSEAWLPIFDAGPDGR